MPFFMEKWVEDKARNRIIREVGIIESEWPAHTATGVASGYCVPDSGSASLLLSIPSATWFKPRMFWIFNSNSNPQELHFYVGGSAGSCSATLQGMYLQAWDTQFVALDGITLGADLYAQATRTGAKVRVGGVLLASGPEN